MIIIIIILSIIISFFIGYVLGAVVYEKIIIDDKIFTKNGIIYKIIAYKIVEGGTDGK